MYFQSARQPSPSLFWKVLSRLSWAAATMHNHTYDTCLLHLHRTCITQTKHSTFVLWIASYQLEAAFWMSLLAVFSPWLRSSGLFDNTLADYLWSRAVMLIGPTLATVALQLQVPMAMMVDPLLKVSGWWSSATAAVLELTGAAGILAGFFWLNFNS
jgi:hypothetical protein